MKEILRMITNIKIVFVHSQLMSFYKQIVNNFIFMPYRRLPNTDAARLKALKSAYNKAKELPPFKLAFSQSTFQKIQSFMPIFEKNITESRFTYANQVKKSKEYQMHLKKARMYISHFIQVLNMGIQRGEIPASARVFYGIREHDKTLPSLNTEEAVIKWGDAVIKGEQQRVLKGSSPMTNPTVAVVKVRYENFIDAYHAQKTMKKSSSRYHVELPQLRVQADEIIAQI